MLKLLSYPGCPAECSERIDAMNNGSLLEAWSAVTGTSGPPTGADDVWQRVCRGDAWSLCQRQTDSSAWETGLVRPGESLRRKLVTRAGDWRYYSRGDSPAFSLMKTIVKLYTARQRAHDRVEAPNVVCAWYDRMGCRPNNERFVFLPHVSVSDVAWLTALVCRDLTVWDVTQAREFGEPGYERWIVVSQDERPDRSDAVDWWTVPSGEQIPGDTSGAPLFFAVFDDHSCVWVEAWNQQPWSNAP